MLAFPDPSTFQVLPWRPSSDGVARIFCDVCTPDRKPFAGDPRNCLRRMFRQAEEAGYIMNVGTELEFYYFPDEHTPKPLDTVGYFDLLPSDSARDVRRNTVLTLEKMSVPVEYTFHSSGPSQHGISLRHAEALTMSDAIMTAKHIIRLEAYEAGIHASFMPKPIAGEASSAMFLHQSLFDYDGNNVFYGEDDPVYHLSPIAKSYMAGILMHAGEISAITNPTVNSYKRLATGKNSSPTPTHATWGLRNRAAMIRIPIYKPGKQLSTRIELRSPDPMANPVPHLRRHAGGWPRRYQAWPAPSGRDRAHRRRPVRPRAARAGLRPAAAQPAGGARHLRELCAHEGRLGRAHPQLFPEEEAQRVGDKYASHISEWEINQYLASS